jgi:hypothetical protein
MKVYIGKYLHLLQMQTAWDAVEYSNAPDGAQVGYVAERVIATPASGLKPKVHRCEVLAASDGSGPLFR